MKILYAIAMEKEGLKIAEQLELKEVESEESDNMFLHNKIYKKDNISLLITGIGKQKTAINLTRYLESNEKPDLIINMGYVGSTDSKIGTWVNVNKTYNYEWEIPGEEKYIIEKFEDNSLKTLVNKEIKKLSCYSAESFVTKTDIKEDVVFDMELYSIFMISKIYNIDLISLKKVSDNLSLDEYYKNLEMQNVMELNSGLKLLEI